VILKKTVPEFEEMFSSALEIKKDDCYNFV
jgi:hypothetical protein